MNPNYSEIVKSVCEKYKIRPETQTDLAKMFVEYHFKDNFTVAILLNHSANVSPICAVGVSKRNKIDPMCPMRGRAIALTRAIKAFCKVG